MSDLDWQLVGVVVFDVVVLLFVGRWLVLRVLSKIAEVEERQERRRDGIN